MGESAISVSSSPPSFVPRRPAPEEALEAFARVRRMSEALCEPLEVEDYVVQSMPDASPIRWHLAHTTWFFETFVLKRYAAGYAAFAPEYEYLFNSYYNAVGRQFPRHRRGVLTRPTVAEVFAYRRAVDEAIVRLIAEAPRGRWDAEIAEVLQTGLQHEQQHQELMLTDVKHLFSCNPLQPAYRAAGEGAAPAAAGSPEWIGFGERMAEIGHGRSDAFCYDNETPRHREWVEPFEVAGRLVSNGEFLRFVEAGGYREPGWWLSEGWATVEAEGWGGPLYWGEREGRWYEFTLAGPLPLDLAAPVAHVSYFEADAYARWTGGRLPTEAEWEVASAEVPIAGTFVEAGALHPQPLRAGGGLRQMFGDLWQWTASPYVGYPGYKPPSGAIGEYNGKFMCNQFVLRGGSVATPRDHIRRTYRNFFPPAARWQFTGIRIAR